MIDSATRGSRWLFLAFSEVSPVHVRSRSPSSPTQTGTLWGEPSGISVARCRLLRRIRAHHLLSPFPIRSECCAFGHYPRCVSASRYREARSHKAVNSGLKPFSLPAPKLLPQEFTTSCANSSERFKCSGRYGIVYPLLIHRGSTIMR